MRRGGLDLGGDYIDDFSERVTERVTFTGVTSVTGTLRGRRNQDTASRLAKGTHRTGGTRWLLRVPDFARARADSRTERIGEFVAVRWPVCNVRLVLSRAVTGAL